LVKFLGTISQVLYAVRRKEHLLESPKTVRDTYLATTKASSRGRRQSHGNGLTTRRNLGLRSIGYLKPCMRRAFAKTRLQAQCVSRRG
jgi:hypothetical protein